MILHTYLYSIDSICLNDTVKIFISNPGYFTEPTSITDSPFVVALIGLVGGLVASILIYLVERKKLYSENTSLALTTLHANLGQLHQVKIEGLKEFNKITFQSFNINLIPQSDTDDYYRTLWENSPQMKLTFEAYLIEFTYGYPNKIKTALKELFHTLMTISANYSESINMSPPLYEPDKETYRMIKTLNGSFLNIIQMIEEDLMINSDFVNNYIKQNQ